MFEVRSGASRSWENYRDDVVLCVRVCPCFSILMECAFLQRAASSDDSRRLLHFYCIYSIAIGNSFP